MIDDFVKFIYLLSYPCGGLKWPKLEMNQGIKKIA